MPPKPPFQLTAEQLAKQQARRLKKLEQAAAAKSGSSVDNPRAKILDRPWIIVRTPEATETRLSIKTWNLLAQCLVRRKLFSTSDCLKSAQREPMLFREFLHPRADILCLQEVDRLEKIIPFLEKAGYGHVYASGPGKKHGCLIAFDQEKFENAGETVVNYDTADRGASFRTRNIGLIVALRNKSSTSQGVVVATTHLFWHPSYSYERTRQAGLLLRATTKFRNKLAFSSWPCILAGDFNFDPADPAYALLVGEPLLPWHAEVLARSRVVHASIDPSVPITTRKQIGSAEDEKEAAKTPTTVDDDDDGGGDGEDDEGENAADPDRRITNARLATAADGLFTDDELAAFYRIEGAPLKGAFEAGQRQHASSAPSESIHAFGQRVELAQERCGYYEPMWTSYTHYWKTVLDYIFVLDPISSTSDVCGYLGPPSTAELEPGIPMMGVGSSDHTPIQVELTWHNAMPREL